MTPTIRTQTIFNIQHRNNILFTPLFEERLCTLMENEQLRQQFSKASQERSKVFDQNAIMLQWKYLFEENVLKIYLDK